MDSAYLVQKHKRKRQIIKDMQEIALHGVEKARERLRHNYDVDENNRKKRKALFDRVATLFSETQDVFYDNRVK